MKSVSMTNLIRSLTGAALLFGASALAQEPAAPATGEAAAAADAEPPFIYTYRPTAKRDPFRSPLQQLLRDGALAVNEACDEPLCQFDLGQLALVAVVTGDANPFAMLQDPQGRGHLVRRNTRVGRQGGKVTQILGDSITVTEYVADAGGKSTPFPISLKLKDDKVSVPVLDLLSGKTIP